MKSFLLIPCADATHLLQAIQSGLDDGFDQVVVYPDDDRDRIDLTFKRLNRDARVQYCIPTKETRVGVQMARECLFHLVSSSGSGPDDLICFLDADDMRIKGALREQRKTLVDNPTLGCCIGHLTSLWKDPLAKYETYQEKKFPFRESLYDFLHYRVLQIGGMLWRREALEELRERNGRIFRPEVKCQHEYSLALDAIKAGIQIGIWQGYSHQYRVAWNKESLSYKNADLHKQAMLDFQQELKELFLEKVQ